MSVRLAHTPTPGHYAHVASSALTDSVVLDEYNGMPTLLVLEIDSFPVLAWMIHGAGDEYQVWVYVPLSKDELSSLYETDLTRLAEWVASLRGRDAFVGLAEDGVLILTTPWVVPRVPAAGLLGEVASAISQELKQALASDLPEKTGSRLRKVSWNRRPLADIC